MLHASYLSPILSAIVVFVSAAVSVAEESDTVARQTDVAYAFGSQSDDEQAEVDAVGYTCDCPQCAEKKGAKSNPCLQSHKGVYYANDFGYLLDPGYTGDCLGDCMKLNPIGNCGRFGALSVGGQLRLRYHHEEGMGRQPGVSGFMDTENDFMLTRLRLYTDWRANEWLRFYAEGISADVLANDLYVPRPIDRNSGDFLNLFFDVRLTESTIVRVGRQELLYGAQRLISPLDWANTRRTFEGIRVLTEMGAWDVDAFYTNYVPVAPDNFDEADYDQSFYGVWATRANDSGPSFDVYYIGYDNQNPYAAVPGRNTIPAGKAAFSVHTFGARMFGDYGAWLYEMQGGVQTGRQSGLGLDHRAGMCTCGLGRKLDMAWSPTVWMYYDYASGDDGEGAFNRFNQLFPLAHKYLGFIDAVERANISSPNCLVLMNPSKKLSLLFWYYYLGADQAGDIIPPVATPSVQNTSSNYFGHELDMIARYQIVPRSNILFGYSNLWRGNKIEGTSDAHFFYSQWELDF